jgi:hypothetical protein
MKTYSRQIANNKTNIDGLKKLGLQYKIANFQFLTVDIPIGTTVNNLIKQIKSS